MSVTAMKCNENIHYLASTTFTIDRKYSDLKAIGKGSYGVVCSALDGHSGRRIAIKKITPMAKHLNDAKHVLREIRLMRHMGKHENIITLEDLIVREAADELYIVMELLDTDLHRVLQSKQLLTESHFKHFLYQLLCGVKYLHENRIIHRDLKPGNLLVTKDCRLRIADFGLARERPTGHGTDPDEEIDEPMTEHVVTRWFRPPELMLCPDGLYTYAVDMWSCGCILGEMLGRKSLFPGKNFVHQLQLIFEVIGSPLPSQVAHITNQQAKKFLETQGGRQKMSLRSVFSDASDSALALLDQFLLFDPEDRITVDTALNSEFLWDVRDPGSLSEVYPPTSIAFEFAFERSCASRNDLKLLIHQESASLRREKRIAASNIASSCSISEGSDEEFFECHRRGNTERTAHGNRYNVAQDCREEDRDSCTESDRDSVKVRSRGRGGRKDNKKQEGRERKGIRTKTEYVESVDHGLNSSNNSSLLNKREKDRVRERDKEKEKEREKEREREREKEKEISIIEAEIEKEKEIQRAYKLVNKLERRLSTSSIICKKEQKSYASGTPAQKSFMPFFSSSVAGALQQQEHQQKEDLHTEHEMHQQHLLEQHARQQRLMQQQLEDLQLQQQQKQMRLQKKRESRATIPGAPNITRPTFVTLSSKPPRDPSTLMSTCRYVIGPGLGSVLGGWQNNEVDTVTCDDLTAYSTYSAGTLKAAVKQREVDESGLDLGRRISDWLSNTAGTPGIVGPNCSEAQCHTVQSRSKSAERNHFDNDVAFTSALLESSLGSPRGTPRGASKRGWGMDVTDDAEAEAATAIMIADRDVEGGRKGEHDGTWTHSKADTSHLHLPLHHHVIEMHDDTPAVLQSEAQAAACSAGYSQRHQVHLRSKGQTNSTIVSEIDSDRECAYINTKSSRSSGVGRGSGSEGRGSVACSTALLGQELERLSQQCSPTGQGPLSGPLSGSVSGSGVGLVTRSVSRVGSGLGLGEGLHVRDERDQSAFCQRLASRRSSSRSPLSTLIPSLTKRDKIKIKYTNDTKERREAGERQSELTASRAGHALMFMDGGSISGFGAVDRKRVTQPVSPKFSKMSWQKERGKGLDEWEGPGQGCSNRLEGSVRDRSLSSGPSAVRRGAGTPLLKPAQGMMTRQGQLGVGFGTCNTIDSASISGSCSGAGNGYGSGHAGVMGRVMGVGGVDAEDKIHDSKKEEGRFGRSNSSSVASTRHLERQVDIERGRGRGSAITGGGQDRGLVGVRAALHSTSHLKYQSNATNALRSRK